MHLCLDDKVFEARRTHGLIETVHLSWLRIERFQLSKTHKLVEHSDWICKPPDGHALNGNYLPIVYRHHKLEFQNKVGSDFDRTVIHKYSKICLVSRTNRYLTSGTLL